MKAQRSDNVFSSLYQKLLDCVFSNDKSLIDNYRNMGRSSIQPKRIRR